MEQLLSPGIHLFFIILISKFIFSSYSIIFFINLMFCGLCIYKIVAAKRQAAPGNVYFASKEFLWGTASSHALVPGLLLLFFSYILNRFFYPLFF